MNFKGLTFDSYLLRYALAKPKAIGLYQKAKKFETEDPANQAKYQWETLKKTIQMACRDVPWYQQSYKDAGISADCLTIENFKEKLPIISRKNIQDNFDQFVSRKIQPARLKISTTGGSTGFPLKIGMDPTFPREIPKWQMFSWWGLSPGSDLASVYREVPVESMKRTMLRLIRWPQQIIQLDATCITEAKIVQFIESYKRLRPKVVHGYVGGLDVLADYIITNNIQIPPPRVVWTTAAPLNQVQTSKLQTAFGAPVCDQYGCSELYFIAAECPHKKGLHIFSDSVHVAILDEQNRPLPNGEFGKIVISNLNDHCFPLIWYENGDYGRLLDGLCTCGMTLPLLDQVKGRVSDNIKLPNGDLLSGEFLTTVFDDFTDVVKQFQIRHRKSGEIVVQAVMTGSPARRKVAIDKVSLELKDRIKNQVPLVMEEVECIPPIRGKLQFVIRE